MNLAVRQGITLNLKQYAAFKCNAQLQTCDLSTQVKLTKCQDFLLIPKSLLHMKGSVHPNYRDIFSLWMFLVLCAQVTATYNEGEWNFISASFLVH